MINLVLTIPNEAPSFCYLKQIIMFLYYSSSHSLQILVFLGYSGLWSTESSWCQKRLFRTLNSHSPMVGKRRVSYLLNPNFSSSQSFFFFFFPAGLASDWVRSCTHLAIGSYSYLVYSNQTSGGDDDQHDDSHLSHTRISSPSLWSQLLLTADLFLTLHAHSAEIFTELRTVIVNCLLIKWMLDLQWIE